MAQRHFPTVWYGCDYNPEQWLDRPDILQEDVRLMRSAGINCVSLGIFSWSFLEPTEGVYQLDWLSEIIDRLYAAGIFTFLATPTAAKPRWMAERYPQTRRMNADGNRVAPGGRHNHCYTSPVYREKARAIILALSRRFGAHPGVVLWHVSNELQGECRCPLCQEAFRAYLHHKYNTLTALNSAWTTAFWSNTYSDWSQLHAPANADAPHGLQLDWKRFVTEQTCDFFQQEVQAIRDGGSGLPVTTNFMEHDLGLDYTHLAALVDIASWDSYPDWHGAANAADELQAALPTAMMHDYMRALKHKPFLLMESTPSTVNWREVSPLKRPGVLSLGGKQALAHGAASVQYFQWRQGRNNTEKFHGAVLGHNGRSDTRVFREVRDFGAELAAIPPQDNACAQARVALLFDRENAWALDIDGNHVYSAQRYLDTALRWYRPLWEAGVTVDVIDMTHTLDGYSLVFAPLLYLQRGNIAEKLRCFVENGGVLLAGYHCQKVDEALQCHLGDTPHGLCDVLGLRLEETDYLPDGKQNFLTWQAERYPVSTVCERIVLDGAQSLAAYTSEFYCGEPALTQHGYGKGQAWYLAAQSDAALLKALTTSLLQQAHIPFEQLPSGVIATERAGAVWLQNYTPLAQTFVFRAERRTLQPYAAICIPRGGTE